MMYSGYEGLVTGRAQFVARHVEIFYIETEVVAPRQLMRPYYVFDDAQGHVLYVSAIAA